MCYREINTEKWEKCIYITGDTVTNPQEPSTLVRQTLEFSTSAIGYKNEEYLEQMIMKYVFNKLINVIKELKPQQRIKFENIDIKSLCYKDKTYEFIILDLHPEIEWRLYKVSENIHLANQMTIGLSYTNLLEYISSNNKYRPHWINSYCLKERDLLIDYCRSVIMESCNTIYKYIINHNGSGNIGYRITERDINDTINDLNHADIKNLWDILPRTPLYRVIDKFNGDINDIKNLSFPATGNESLDFVVNKIKDKYIQEFNDDKLNADKILHAGIIDDIENKDSSFLFEYRHVKEEMNIMKDLIIKTNDYLCKWEEI